MTETAPTTKTPGASPQTAGEPVASFPVVGIGASAGGLAAFEAFFSGMPVDAGPGMAFVLVQHLAPDHESMLSDLIRRCTRMQVFDVEDGMTVRPDCVYIIRPGRDMAFLNGNLELLEPSAPRGHRLPIDFFFRSLAEDQRERAIAVVLSGTGSDGSLGVRAIKAEGGMVMAQTPESAQFDGMPRSAIATGLVDCELAPAEMPARLVAHVAAASGGVSRTSTDARSCTEHALKKVFDLLRAQTGHDFSQYKPSTVHRRIARRMAVHQIDGMDFYVRYLQQAPAEVEALFRDLLIGVTRFFRDPEAFRIVEERVLPDLFSDRPADAVVRIWSAGCSTGEEAYSLAILLQECMEERKAGTRVQIFATDIDGNAVATARAGLYPAGIAADVSPQRLARFFTSEPDGKAYRVHKRIRDMLIFSVQDLTKDPPFSRLDLLVCRNVLIYMGAELQRKLIPLFHYALKPGGTLFLSTSESIGTFDELFSVIDLSSKLYRREPHEDGFLPGPHGLMRSSAPPPVVPAPRPFARPAAARKPSLRELTEQALLEQVAPVGALVNGEGDILYLHGRTGMWLEPTPGETGVNNILKMSREGLRHELALTLRKAASLQEPVHSPGLRVRTNGHHTIVDLTVVAVAVDARLSPESPLYLVIVKQTSPLEQVPAPGGSSTVFNDRENEPDSNVVARIAALERELRAKDEHLQMTREELEASNEELKSSNEEMQSVNEELQSTNEELETSKEELQSVNEELGTVNTELYAKVTDLSRVNNDMNNLLAGTGIGTVFVDLHLHIMRFTPAASVILNLIPGDTGRPLRHIVSNLVGYDNLMTDAQAVLDTLIPREVDVQTADGAWYSMRILPYRTLDNLVEGAVITFVCVTEIVRSREVQRRADDLLRLAMVVRDASDAITVQDLDGRILAWNPGATRLYGWTESEALGMHARDRIPEGLRDRALTEVTELSRSRALESRRTQRIARDGAILDVWVTSTPLLDEAGSMYGIATTERAGESPSIARMEAADD